MKFDNIQLLAPSPMNANQTSQVLDLTSCPWASLQFIVTGAAAPTGTAAIQFSDDPAGQTPAGPPNPGSWGVDAGFSAPVVTANGNTMVNLANVGHRWMRVVFTAGTGNGTLAINAMSKGG